MGYLIGIVGGLLGVYLLIKGYALEKVFGLGIAGCACILMGILEEKPAESVLGVVCVVIAVVLWIVATNRAKDPSVKKELEQEIKQEYEEAVKSQSADEPWAVKYSTSPCPYCGHYKVRSAKWEDKRMSIAFWGIASNAIGKQYKCEHCENMWD